MKSNTLQIIDVYTAYVTTNELGNLGPLIGVFTTKSDADNAASGRGWYGGMGNISMRKAVVVPGSNNVYLLDETNFDKIPANINLLDSRKNLKEKALSKLTEEEKQALGI